MSFPCKQQPDSPGCLRLPSQEQPDMMSAGDTRESQLVLQLVSWDPTASAARNLVRHTGRGRSTRVVERAGPVVPNTRCVSSSSPTHSAILAQSQQAPSFPAAGVRCPASLKQDDHLASTSAPGTAPSHCCVRQPEAKLSQVEKGDEPSCRLHRKLSAELPSSLGQGPTFSSSVAEAVSCFRPHCLTAHTTDSGESAQRQNEVSSDSRGFAPTTESDTGKDEGRRNFCSVKGDSSTVGVSEKDFNQKLLQSGSAETGEEKLGDKQQRDVFSGKGSRTTTTTTTTRESPSQMETQGTGGGGADINTAETSHSDREERDKCENPSSAIERCQPGHHDGELYRPPNDLISPGVVPLSCSRLSPESSDSRKEEGEKNAEEVDGSLSPGKNDFHDVKWVQLSQEITSAEESEEGRSTAPDNSPSSVSTSSNVPQLSSLSYHRFYQKTSSSTTSLSPSSLLSVATTTSSPPSDSSSPSSSSSSSLCSSPSVIEAVASSLLSSAVMCPTAPSEDRSNSEELLLSLLGEKRNEDPLFYREKDHDDREKHLADFTERREERTVSVSPECHKEDSVEEFLSIESDRHTAENHREDSHESTQDVEDERKREGKGGGVRNGIRLLQESVDFRKVGDTRGDTSHAKGEDDSKGEKEGNDKDINDRNSAAIRTDQDASHSLSVNLGSSTRRRCIRDEELGQEEEKKESLDLSNSMKRLLTRYVRIEEDKHLLHLHHSIRLVSSYHLGKDMKATAIFSSSLPPPSARSWPSRGSPTVQRGKQRIGRDPSEDEEEEEVELLKQLGSILRQLLRLQERKTGERKKRRLASVSMSEVDEGRKDSPSFSQIMKHNKKEGFVCSPVKEKEDRREKSREPVLEEDRQLRQDDGNDRDQANRLGVVKEGGTRGNSRKHVKDQDKNEERKQERAREKEKEGRCKSSRRRPENPDGDLACRLDGYRKVLAGEVFSRETSSFQTSKQVQPCQPLQEEDCRKRAVHTPSHWDGCSSVTHRDLVKSINLQSTMERAAIAARLSDAQQAPSSTRLLSSTFMDASRIYRDAEERMRRTPGNGLITDTSLVLSSSKSDPSSSESLLMSHVASSISERIGLHRVRTEEGADLRMERGKKNEEEKENFSCAKRLKSDEFDVGKKRNLADLQNVKESEKCSLGAIPRSLEVSSSGFCSFKESDQNEEKEEREVAHSLDPLKNDLKVITANQNDEGVPGASLLGGVTKRGRQTSISSMASTATKTEESEEGLRERKRMRDDNDDREELGERGEGEGEKEESRLEKIFEAVSKLLREGRALSSFLQSSSTHPVPSPLSLEQNEERREREAGDDGQRRRSPSSGVRTPHIVEWPPEQLDDSIDHRAKAEDDIGVDLDTDHSNNKTLDGDEEKRDIDPPEGEKIIDSENDASLPTASSSSTASPPPVASQISSVDENCSAPTTSLRSSLDSGSRPHMYRSIIRKLGHAANQLAPEELVFLYQSLASSADTSCLKNDKKLPVKDTSGTEDDERTSLDRSSPQEENRSLSCRVASSSSLSGSSVNPRLSSRSGHLETIRSSSSSPSSSFLSQLRDSLSLPLSSCVTNNNSPRCLSKESLETCHSEEKTNRSHDSHTEVYACLSSFRKNKKNGEGEWHHNLNSLRTTASTEMDRCRAHFERRPSKADQRVQIQEVEEEEEGDDEKGYLGEISPSLSSSSSFFRLISSSSGKALGQQRSESSLVFEGRSSDHLQKNDRNQDFCTGAKTMKNRDGSHGVSSFKMIDISNAVLCEERGDLDTPSFSSCSFSSPLRSTTSFAGKRIVSHDKLNKQRDQQVFILPSSSFSSSASPPTISSPSQSSLLSYSEGHREGLCTPYEARDRYKPPSECGAVRGVYFDVTNQAWAANMRVNGKVQKKSFSLKRYGRAARRKAVEARREMERIFGRTATLPYIECFPSVFPPPSSASHYLSPQQHSQCYVAPHFQYPRHLHYPGDHTSTPSSVDVGRRDAMTSMMEGKNSW
ncbi:ap2 domain transcription factor ap2ix-9 [Cystoisospora suis]|uniref:Ap2 domain transcription factor ap2ix-9 n=1 Tax=Cystoisospora suis TaxID=483139 RepID=A0A2C6KLU4_9APIC|nr:ap2 domain transcription factor ap2ix-9 [Cystoisospora suis]